MFPLRHHVRTGLNRIFLHRANVHWTKLRSDDITVPDQEHDLPEKLWDSFLCDSRICPCSLINAPATTIMMDTLCCSAQHVDKHQKRCSPNDMCGAGTHNRKCKACENACIVPESLLPPITVSISCSVMPHQVLWASNLSTSNTYAVCYPFSHNLCMHDGIDSSC